MPSAKAARRACDGRTAPAQGKRHVVADDVERHQMGVNGPREGVRSMRSSLS